MNFLDAVPAIRRIDTDRSDLIAVDIVGRVLPADAENLFGLLEAAYALHPAIDALVRLVEYEDTDWDGLSGRTLERGRKQALRHVRRCATIGGPARTGPGQPSTWSPASTAAPGSRRRTRAKRPCRGAPRPSRGR